MDIVGKALGNVGPSNGLAKVKKALTYNKRLCEQGGKKSHQKSVLPDLSPLIDLNNRRDLFTEKYRGRLATLEKLYFEILSLTLPDCDVSDDGKSRSFKEAQEESSGAGIDWDFKGDWVLASSFRPHSASNNSVLWIDRKNKRSAIVIDDYIVGSRNIDFKSFPAKEIEYHEIDHTPPAYYIDRNCKKHAL
ncbi:MAG TPA: hypothetical protein PLU50_00140 [Pseudobdellovibrionaceae bacterium]|nr:hypothetical protein [Pseudobdellovibrionaceae bacterium]